MEKKKPNINKQLKKGSFPKNEHSHNKQTITYNFTRGDQRNKINKPHFF
jgi:hypothetical protein